MLWFIICTTLLKLNWLPMSSGAEYRTNYHYDVIFVDDNKMALIEEDVIPMMLHGEKYHCKIPSKQKFYPDKLMYSTYANKVNNMPCQGWFDGKEWLYNFCPKTGITQIHLSHLKFSLGSKYTDYFEESKVNDFYGSKVGLNLVRNYTGGDKCELTGRNRSSLVRFVCDPFREDRIILLSEIYTCEYAVEVKTKRVCFSKDIAGLPLFCGSKTNPGEHFLKKMWSWRNEKLVQKNGKHKNDSTFQASLSPDSIATRTISDKGKNSSNLSYPNYFYYAEDVMLAIFLEEGKSRKLVHDLLKIYRLFPTKNNPLNLSNIVTLRKNLNFVEGFKFHLYVLMIPKIQKETELKRVVE